MGTKTLNIPIVRLTMSQLIHPNVSPDAVVAAADLFRIQVSHLYPIERLTLRDEIADLLDEAKKDLRIGVLPANSVPGLARAWDILS